MELNIQHGEPYTTRRWIAGALVGITALGGSFIAKGIINDAAKGGHEYTTSQLAHMPQQPETFAPGQGPDALIFKVDPGLADDGQGLADVENYVQAENGGNTVYQSGQQVNIPVVAPDK